MREIDTIEDNNDNANTRMFIHANAKEFYTRGLTFRKTAIERSEVI